MIVWKSAFCATVALASAPVAAQDGGRSGPEIGVGIFRHGANFHPLGDELIFDAPPPDVFYADSGENGTVDIQLLYRTAPLTFLLKPRLTAKVQVSTAGRTSFASIGAEWRQHALKNRIYGQVGIGVTIHDGYRFTPDPFEPGLSNAEAWRRYDIATTRVGFGSRVLFNPNASIGVRLSPRWAVEAVWEHHSHRQIFNEVNPGIDHLGIRLIRSVGRR
ncbi:MAG TPA: acyloxyacyl hydrolase [Sphingomonas sp.]|nr:acyloxyacyl hydrolase [Sphingomonas sp.]